tara:strand:+ start:289 stop:498 length:210 start_codon:yes stop_codon:yes gene_type:complete
MSETQKPRSSTLPGILYVVGLCALLVAISVYYKGADTYCRYQSKDMPLLDMAPECRDADTESIAADPAE